MRGGPWFVMVVTIYLEVCMGYKVVKRIYMLQWIYSYEVTANGTPMQWFEFLSKAFNRIGRMTSALISCMLHLDFCIFFFSEEKGELKVCAAAKRVWTRVMDGWLEFFPGSFFPSFASSMFLSFNFELWHLVGKEFNNVFKIWSKALQIGENWPFAIHSKYQ